eukprot:scaffold1012_cov418-Prasinococcus_capsulatus_cf.AAC.4
MQESRLPTKPSVEPVLATSPRQGDDRWCPRRPRTLLTPAGRHLSLSSALESGKVNGRYLHVVALHVPYSWCSVATEGCDRR